MRTPGPNLVSTDEIVNACYRESENIEGVTFCGGEPFSQPQALAVVAQRVKAMGLSVVSFSGYTLEELGELPDSNSLLQHVDILIDGRYRRDLPDRERNWVGSTNQRFHFLSDRYSPGVEFPANSEARIGPLGGHGRIERL